MRILQVSTADQGGGAESIAAGLHQAYRRHGHDAWLAVGSKQTDCPHVWEIPQEPYRSMWARWVREVSTKLLSSVQGLSHGERAIRLLSMTLSEPARTLNRIRGREEFSFPGTYRLLDGAPITPDVLHCHNLHGAWLREGGYFDLRALSTLSRAVPTILTLHDAWLLSGHCAHSFECDRWKAGCGHCPDLTIYPAIRRDATAGNWLRKRDILSRSRLFVATPSQWLMNKVKESILLPGIEETRVIPHGVDLTVFRPGDKREARECLALPQQSWIVLFAANSISKNPWKDFKTLRAAVKHLAAQEKDKPVHFVAVGEGNASDKAQVTDVQFVPLVREPLSMARYYQAADIYVHAARVDTFPNTVMEATACGTPVIATAVGGIPEQVLDGRSGFLVPAGDAEAMARHAQFLFENEERRRMISAQAAEVGKARFDLNRQVQAYLDWYEQLVMSSERKGVLSHAC